MFEKRVSERVGETTAADRVGGSTSTRRRGGTRGAIGRELARLSLAIVVLSLAAIHHSVAQADFEKGEKAFGSGDYATALREWRPLAERGLAEAQFNLAQMHKLGLGVPQNYAQAVIWYRKAANQGHAGARHNVGGAFYTGRGVPQDYTEAARWFERAAEFGHFESQFNLGLMYARGEGVPMDDVRAYKWFFLANLRAPLDEHRRRTARSLHVVRQRMTSFQILEAERLIREWRAKFRESRLVPN